MLKFRGYVMVVRNGKASSSEVFQVVCRLCEALQLIKRCGIGCCADDCTRLLRTALVVAVPFPKTSENLNLGRQSAGRNT